MPAAVEGHCCEVQAAHLSTIDTNRTLAASGHVVNIELFYSILLYSIHSSISAVRPTRPKEKVLLHEFGFCLFCFVFVCVRV